jgi:putative Ca2+/H+ antiporter (TMEM165/GDT1 family)
MSWNLTRYVEREMTRAMENPTTVAFTALCFALFAGTQLGYQLGTSSKHSLLLEILDWFCVAMFLVSAADRLYFLIKAVHQLQQGRSSTLPS